MTDIFNIIGIVGVVFVVGAYILIQAGKITAEQMIYPALNFFGAMGILISLFEHWNLPAVVIQTIWLWISAYGIFTIGLKEEIKNT
jgi:hypothetical protein